MRPSRAKDVERRKAFTLIELMTVIVVIAALAGIVLSAARYAAQRAEETKARAIMAEIENALAEYRAIYHVGARSPQGWSSSSLRSYPTNMPTRAELLDPSARPDVTSLVWFVYSKPLKEGYRALVDPGLISSNNGALYILDPWGGPFIYYGAQRYDHSYSPTEMARSGAGYSILSLGRHETNPEDDIKNW
jgi:prepilin-type N-terminal cleavage/methylation domain-containing protein